MGVADPAEGDGARRRDGTNAPATAPASDSPAATSAAGAKPAPKARAEA